MILYVRFATISPIGLSYKSALVLTSGNYLKSFRFTLTDFALIARYCTKVILLATSKLAE